MVFPLNDFYSIGVDLTHVTNCGVFASKVVGESPSGGLGPVQLFAKMVLGDDIGKLDRSSTNGQTRGSQEKHCPAEMVVWIIKGTPNIRIRVSVLV